MNDSTLHRISHIIIIALGAVAIGYLGIKVVIPIAMPFLIAWAIAFFVRPPARFLASKTRISVRIISPVLAVLILLVLVSVIASLAVTLGAQLWEFISELAKNGELDKLIAKILNPFEGKLSGIHSAELEAHLTEAVSGLISRMLSSFGELLSSVVSGVPRILFFVLITVIATVYFCADLENINRTVAKHLPGKILALIIKFKHTTLDVSVRYLRSYLIIMLVTFAIMIVGFSLLGVEYALLLSVVIALLDALPALGVGTVLVPYSVIAFVSGNFPLGIGVLVLLAVNEIVRQLIEPKILGKSLGIHPLVTIVLLYAGYSLFGLFGLILLPVFVIIINSLVAKSKTAEVEKKVAGRVK